MDRSPRGRIHRVRNEDGAHRQTQVTESPSLGTLRNAMIIVHVHVHVKTESVDAFIAATRENARQSLREPGIARFDVVQQADDPTRFVLVEIYRNDHAPAAHKNTAHYQAWRDAVEPWMAEPRRSTRFHPIEPEALCG